uniref:F-box domain-containing protein n=1 Tax=Schizaphis graminum TaxID=13262 RepID=A0A2S2PN23_SCHGA
MISHIFAFLKLEDKKVASSVCWSWYNVSILPRFLKNEVISLKDLKNDKMIDVLKIYTKSLRPFFAFRISVFEDEKLYYGSSSINKNQWHWVYTVWSFLGAKVVYLEVFIPEKFNDGILPALLNVTEQLKVLKINNLRFSSNEELYKVNRLQSLEELVLVNLHIHNIDKKKLLGIIPKQLRKLCFNFMPNSKFIIEDLTDIFKFCSSHLESLELIDIEVTLALMESIVSLNMKLKKFGLSINYDQEPEIILPLFKTQWPLVDLQLSGECLTYEHLFAITNTFKDLENLSVTGKSISSFEVLVGISGSSFDSLTKVTKSINSLKKLKSLCIGVERT